MCGVIGFSTKSFQESDIQLLKQLFLETQIRGKHATGLSYLKDGIIITEKYPITAKEFIEIFEWERLLELEEVHLIGHIRYSTSDLEFNQPIADDKFSIVHNGVITQKDPEEWEREFGYKCKTKNDSELLWNFLQEESIENVFDKFHGCSFSVVTLSENGLENYRNGLRPQWTYEDTRIKIVASTFNILYRCGLKKELIKEVQPLGKNFINHHMEEVEC